MLRLRIKAPFAAFRTLTAGYLRPTMTFIPPSAIYGIILNLAGIESRLYDEKSSVTLMRKDLPSLDIAFGAVNQLPGLHSVFQQLHNYPVGTTGKEHAKDCKGSKYNIQPVRREFLSGFDAVICIRNNPDIEKKIRMTLSGKSPMKSRYGIPFLGDNNFMIDIIREEKEKLTPVFWFKKISPEAFPETKKSLRFTVWIDREDMRNTVTDQYTMADIPEKEIFDELAWTNINPVEFSET
jgi:CRISPR-associated protein Cas5/DevS